MNKISLLLIMFFSTCLVAQKELSSALSAKNPNLFRIMYQTEAEYKFTRHDYSGAVKALTQAIEYSPFDAELFIDRADTKYKAKNYQGALNDYIISIRIKPQLTQLYLKIAKCREKIGNIKAAIADLTTYLEHDRINDKIFAERAQLWKKLGRYIKAHKDVAQAILINPYEASYHDLMNEIDIVLSKSLDIKDIEAPQVSQIICHGCSKKIDQSFMKAFQTKDGIICYDCHSKE